MRRTQFLGVVVGIVALLVVTAGCALFNAAPVAGFSWSPQDPLARTDVQFTDLSTDAGGLFGGGGVTLWNWDFGDNDSSPSQNPKHSYEVGGTYTVRLTVTDGAGKSATSQKQITVTPTLDGRWTGSFTDINWNTLAMSIDIGHSASGGITGTLYIVAQAFPLVSGSFNATTREVQLTFSLVVFRGTLDASEHRISGFWYDSISGIRGEDWFVTLQ
ncbi:MAG: PKD domain-containing protein [Candidatus Bipolaricaulota bacterium]|nr:MAG: PKD domain-containing protein [Candidatus Bipolaricaulota bacterium]